jgi:hypothetical protein
MTQGECGVAGPGWSGGQGRRRSDTHADRMDWGNGIINLRFLNAFGLDCDHYLCSTGFWGLACTIIVNSMSFGQEANSLQWSQDTLVARAVEVVGGWWVLAKLCCRPMRTKQRCYFDAAASKRPG